MRSSYIYLIYKALFSHYC